jgi:hypothetical protein
MNIFKEIYRSIELSINPPIKEGMFLLGNSVELLKPSTIVKLNLTSKDNDLLLYVSSIKDGLATVVGDVLVKAKLPDQATFTTETRVFTISLLRLEVDYIEGKLNKISKSKAESFLRGDL